MNKTGRTMLFGKLLALALTVMMLFTVISVPAKAEEGETSSPKIIGVTFYGGEDGDVFYEGFNDNYVIRAGSEITIEYEGDYSQTYYIRNDLEEEASIDSNYYEDNEVFSLREDEEGQVYLDYLADESSFYLYTKKVLPLDDMEKLTKGKITVNTGSRFTKYYLVDADELISGDEGLLHTYTRYSEGYDEFDSYLELYTLDGERIKSDDDAEEGLNASLYYGIKSGEKYILALFGFNHNYEIITDLITEDAKKIVGIEDAGSKIYPQFEVGDIRVKYIYEDGSSEIYTGRYGVGPLNVCWAYDEEDGGPCYLYIRNNSYYEDNWDLADESLKDFHLELKSPSVVTYTPANYSSVPAYEMGSVITVPADSFAIYSTTLSNYMKWLGKEPDDRELVVLNSKGHRGYYNIGSDSRLYTWIYNGDYDDYGTKSYATRPEDLSGTCLIMFDNRYWDTPYQTGLMETDANGNAIVPPAPQPAPKPVAPAAPAVGSTVAVAGSQYKVTSASTVSLLAAKKGKTATVPAAIAVNGRNYAVTGIDKKAFKKSKATSLVVKSKGLTKKSVKGCLKGTKVKVVKVKVGKKKENKKFVKKYKKIFTKKICGAKVTVK